jgi:hypothetical protein
MLLPCNNTAISAASVIISRMSEADDLAQRYLTLWTQYLTALLADPRAMETLKRWAAFTGQFAYPAPGTTEAGGAPFPVWPPFFGPFGMPPVPPGAADARPDRLAALAQRVDALERRLAALERKPPRKAAARRPPRKHRSGGG